MGQVLVVGQVLVQGPGGDLGVALAELGYEQLVRLAPALVLSPARGVGGVGPRGRAWQSPGLDPEAAEPYLSTRS